MRKRIAATLALILSLSACAPTTNTTGGTRSARGGAGERRESLTYLYAGTTASYLKILDDSGSSITTVCPDYFDLNADGSLLITPSNKIDPAFIAEMHRREIRVTPFVSNHWDRILGNTALDNRAALAQALADVVTQYGLDGINVDIENVNETYRDAYTDFVRLLRAALPDKLVTVAVAANPKGWTLGWHGSYDYKSLSDYADYLMLMTYDESYYGSEPGPISSRTFFEGSIDYALRQGVPKEKIVAGLPFFGRFWQEGASVGGFGITASDVEYLLANYDAQTVYDVETRSANVTLTITEADPKPTLWGGRILSEGTYHIWYDNLTSVRYKLDKINAYALRGAGSWALGQEDRAIWDFYTATLNGGTIPSGLQSNLDWILDVINQSGSIRTVTGESVLTRADMAVLFAEMTNLKPELYSETFADAGTHWARGHINALRRRGILRGTGDNLYYPDRPVTREELVGVLERLLVLPNTIDFHTMTFLDVTPAMWSYAPISKFYYFGLMRGYGPEYFGPYDTIAAATMSLILDRIDRFGYPLNADKLLPELGARSKSGAAPRLTGPLMEPR